MQLVWPQQHFRLTWKYGSIPFEENFIPYFTDQNEATSSLESWIHWHSTTYLGLVHWWLGWAETQGWPLAAADAQSQHQVWRNKNLQNFLAQWAEAKAIFIVMAKTSFDKPCYIFTDLSYC